MSETLRLFANTKSHCCGKPQQLVQSREGGFVTKNCCGCKGSAMRVGLSELPLLACEACGKTMFASIQFKNYAYECAACHQRFQLSARLPWWTDEFDYCGVAVSSDSPSHVGVAS